MTAVGSAMRSVHWVPSDPGVAFVKDPGAVVLPPALDGEWKALTPCVVALPSGGYRLYYTLSGPGRDYGPTRAVILSCFSADGSSWEPEPGVRVAPFGVDAAVRVVCPDVVPVPASFGGGWRMYLEGQPAEPRASVIVSARSFDGLAWEPEAGVRFSGPRRYGSPRVVVTSSDPLRYRMYFHSYSHPLVIAPDASNHIVSAVSSDGLTFSLDPGVRIAQSGPLQSFAVYAPEVLRVGDGPSAFWRMYYAGWQRDPVRGRIFAARSTDGVVWDRDPGVVLDVGGEFDREKCSEPCLIRLPDGRYRMFYEASDEHAVWRILSATTLPV